MALVITHNHAINIDLINFWKSMITLSKKNNKKIRCFESSRETFIIDFINNGTILANLAHHLSVFVTHILLVGFTSLVTGLFNLISFYNHKGKFQKA